MMRQEIFSAKDRVLYFRMLLLELTVAVELMEALVARRIVKCYLASP